MYAPDETQEKRRNWGAVYTFLMLMGVSFILPATSPTTLAISLTLTLAMGTLMVLGYGASAVATLFLGKKFMWIENASSWLGHAGLVTYVATSIQSIITAEATFGNRAPLVFGFLALLVVMVSRSFRLQRHLKVLRNLKEIVRIANRNDRN